MYDGSKMTFVLIFSAYLNRCCEPSNTDITAPFNTTEKENLRRDCLEKAISSSCKVPPQQKLIGSINDVSLLVTVTYTCDNEGTLCNSFLIY